MRHLTVADLITDYQLLPYAEKLHRIESSIRREPNEHFVGLDRHGEILFEVEGGKSITNFNSHVIQLLKEKAYVVTHNHPWDVPPSDKDLHMLVYYRLHEIRAVTRTYTYIIRNPNNIWTKKKLAAYAQYRKALLYYLAKYGSDVSEHSFANIMGHKDTLQKILLNAGLEYEKTF